MVEQSKADLLQLLLETQQLCLDLFDEVEAHKLDISRERLISFGVLIGRLTAMREAMVWQYARRAVVADFQRVNGAEPG